MPAPPERDRAERALVVAPLAHLQIRDVPEAADGQSRAWVPAHSAIEQTPHHQLRHQLGQITQAQEKVDLGDRLLQFLTITLDQTAHRNQRPQVPAIFQPCGSEQRIDRFFLGWIDEGASVDDKNLRQLRLRRIRRTVTDQRGHDALGVDCILVATEGYDRELQRVNTSTPAGGENLNRSSEIGTPASTLCNVIVRIVSFSSKISNFRTR